MRNRIAVLIEAVAVVAIIFAVFVFAVRAVAAPPQCVLSCPPQNVLAVSTGCSCVGACDCPFGDDCGCDLTMSRAGVRWEAYRDGSLQQAKLVNRNGEQVGTWRFADHTYWPVKRGGGFGPCCCPPIEPPAHPSPKTIYYQTAPYSAAGACPTSR